MNEREVPYPDDPKVTCECGAKFMMWWNGGELSAHQCKCGRFYLGEHKVTVMIIQEPEGDAQRVH